MLKKRQRKGFTFNDRQKELIGKLRRAYNMTNEELCAFGIERLASAPDRSEWIHFVNHNRLEGTRNIKVLRLKDETIEKILEVAVEYDGNQSLLIEAALRYLDEKATESQEHDKEKVNSILKGFTENDLISAIADRISDPVAERKLSQEGLERLRKLLL